MDGRIVQFLVLDGGVIRDRGRHNALLAQGDLYARLHESQFAVSAT